MQRITRILLALLLATLAACSDPPPPAAAKAVATDKEIPAANPTDDHHSREVFCKPSIHPFWKKFRAAILAEDAEAVADMTEFPLDIVTAKEGRAEPLSRAEFIKRFPQFLNAAPTRRYEIEKLKITSMQERIRQYPILEKNACGDFETILAFDRWTFQLYEKTRWKLDNVDAQTFTK